MLNKKSCIYAIRNTKTNQLYIGKTVCYKDRLYYHQSYLEKNNHFNKYLQNSWNKYGKEVFEFYVIEFCDEDNLDEKEIFYINKYKSNVRKFGFNLTIGGEGSSGYKHTEEQKDKKRGENNPMWGRTGENHPAFGRILSQDAKEKISKSKTGIPRPEHVVAILKSFTWEGRNHPTIGRKHSDEEKQKMRENHADFSGENHPSWGKKRRKSSSKYFGVCYNKKNKKWMVTIYSPSKLYIGSFSSEIEAAMAYNDYIISHDLPNCLNEIES